MDYKWKYVQPAGQALKEKASFCFFLQNGRMPHRVLMASLNNVNKDRELDQQVGQPNLLHEREVIPIWCKFVNYIFFVLVL